MILPALFFYLFAGVCVASAGDGDCVAQSRALGALSHSGVGQRIRPVRADGCRIPRNDPRRGLCQVLGVGAPLGGRLCLQALKEAHGLLLDLLGASDLDCLLYEATGIRCGSWLP